MKHIVTWLFILLFVVAAAFALFGGQNAAIFTSIAAIVALGVSLFNFWFQHFRNVHDLSCTLVAIGYDGHRFTAHYTFENTGSHQEIVLGGTFVFPQKGEGRSYTTIIKRRDNSRMPEMMEPFLIKPKEVLVKEFEWSIAYADLMIHIKSMNELEQIGMEAEFPMAMKVDFVDPSSRSKASKLIRVADVKFASDFAYCSRANHGSVKLFEGDRCNI